MLSLVVCASVALPAAQSTPPASTNAQAELFARDRVLDVDIRMPAGDWQQVRISHRDGGGEDLSALTQDAYEYRRAEVRIDGTTIGSVGVRKKGFVGSAVSTRPSLKIRFDEYVQGQTFLGADMITLNNNNQDQTLVQQYLAYDLFARAGVPASRANFARVRVNGEDLGIYTHVESIRRPLLSRLFGSSNGLLYESYGGDFSDPGFANIIEKSGSRQQDRGRLLELKTALAGPGPVPLDRIEALVDLDSFIRLWAAEVLIGHWDSYSGNRNNYYLYLNPSSRKFHVLPWGADSVFQDPGPFITQKVPKSVKAIGILCNRLWQVPAIRDRYRAEMTRLLAGPWNEARMQGDTARLQQLLQPQSTISRETMEAASAAALAFIRSRRSEVSAELAGPAPDWPGNVSSITAPGNRGRMTITGSFTAPWHAAAPANPLASGTATLSVTVDGTPRPGFERAGAFSTTNPQTTVVPASLREKYKVITLTALAGTRIWQISLTIDPHQLTTATRELPVDHFTVWAILVEIDATNPTVPKVRPFGVVGQLHLDDVAPSAGGQMRGAFTLRTSEL